MRARAATHQAVRTACLITDVRITHPSRVVKYTAIAVTVRARAAAGGVVAAVTGVGTCGAAAREPTLW